MSSIVNEELGVIYSIREEEEEEEEIEESHDLSSAEQQQPTIFDDGDYNVGSSNYITFNIFTQERKEVMWYRTMSEASGESVPRSTEEEGGEKRVKSWKKKVGGVIGKMTKMGGSWSENHPDGGILVETGLRSRTDSPGNRKKGNGGRLMGGCLYRRGENRGRRRKKGGGE